MAILLIEDDADLRELAEGLLQKAGFSVDIAVDGPAGFKMGKTGHYDVIVLDLGLPGLDGLSLLKQLRTDGVETHVLILTAKDSPDDRILGLDSGADDYMNKSRIAGELEARVRALIRRKHHHKNPLLVVGDLEINTSSRNVSRAGRKISLTPREYALLEFLAYHQGKLVTRTDIWEHLYAMESDATSNVVDVYIAYLRKKIETEGLSKLIHTKRGEGFIIEAETTPQPHSSL
jgi:DNA-binding response OmpR family regulator